MFCKKINYRRNQSINRSDESFCRDTRWTNQSINHPFCLIIKINILLFYESRTVEENPSGDWSGDQEISSDFLENGFPIHPRQFPIQDRVPFVAWKWTKNITSVQWLIEWLGVFYNGLLPSAPKRNPVAVIRPEKKQVQVKWNVRGQFLRYLREASQIWGNALGRKFPPIVKSNLLQAKSILLNRNMECLIDWLIDWPRVFNVEHCVRESCLIRVSRLRSRCSWRTNVVWTINSVFFALTSWHFLGWQWDDNRKERTIFLPGHIKYYYVQYVSTTTGPTAKCIAHIAVSAHDTLDCTAHQLPPTDRRHISSRRSAWQRLIRYQQNESQFKRLSRKMQRNFEILFFFMVPVSSHFSIALCFTSFSLRFGFSLLLLRHLFIK